MSGETLKIRFEDDSIIQINKNWFIERSHFVENLFKHQMKPVEEIKLETVLNSEQASHLLSTLNNDYQWLNNLDLSLLPGVMDMISATIDYLDIKEGVINPLPPYTVRVLFLLTFLKRNNSYNSEDNFISNLRETIYSLDNPNFSMDNLRNEVLELTQLLQILPFTDTMAISLAQLIQDCHCLMDVSYTAIEVIPDENFFKGLRELAGEWSWLDKINEWPKGLILAGESVASILFDREKCYPNWDLTFYTFQRRKTFGNSLKYLSGKDKVKYNMYKLDEYESLVGIFKKKSKDIQLIYTEKSSIYDITLKYELPHLMAYYDGHKICLAPEAYIAWKKRIISKDITNIQPHKLSQVLGYSLKFLTPNDLFERLLSWLGLPSFGCRYHQLNLIKDGLWKSHRTNHGIDLSIKKISENFRYPALKIIDVPNINKVLESIHVEDLLELPDTDRKPKRYRFPLKKSLLLRRLILKVKISSSYEWHQPLTLWCEDLKESCKEWATLEEINNLLLEAFMKKMLTLKQISILKNGRPTHSVICDGLAIFNDLQKLQRKSDFLLLNGKSIRLECRSSRFMIKGKLSREMIVSLDLFLNGFRVENNRLFLKKKVIRIDVIRNLTPVLKI